MAQPLPNLPKTQPFNCEFDALSITPYVAVHRHLIVVIVGIIIAIIIIIITIIKAVVTSTILLPYDSRTRN